MIGDTLLRPDLFPNQTERDTFLLLTKIASWGALSLKQAANDVLFQRTPAEVRTLMTSLSRQELLTVDRVGIARVPDQPSVRLTPAGWGFALDKILRRAKGESWERLAQLSITGAHRHAIGANRKTPVNWLNTKRLLMAFDAPAEQDFFMAWATNWQPAFPTDLRGVPLPDPAYVAVVNIDGYEILIFGECNDPTQPLSGFRKKMEVYAQLARRPDFVEQVFGYRDFHVWVTVADPVQRSPMVRMRELIEIARQERSSHVTSFTLQHWVFDSVTDEIWFMNGEKPRSNSQDSADHDNAHRYIDIVDNVSAVLDAESLRSDQRLNTYSKIPPGR